MKQNLKLFLAILSVLTISTVVVFGANFTKNISEDDYGAIGGGNCGGGSCSNSVIVPITSYGQYNYVTNCTVEMHDHHKDLNYSIEARTQYGSYTQIVSPTDLQTGDPNDYCKNQIGDRNYHPHNDSSCYTTIPFSINNYSDSIRISFSNENSHAHIQNLNCNISSGITPTPPIQPCPQCNFPEPRFPDVPLTHPYYQYINALASDNIVNGFSDGYYRPSYPVTREAMAKYMKNGYEFTNYTMCGDFNDVHYDNAFYYEITSLKCRGIVSGQNNYFSPKSLITRGEAMKIIINGARVRKGDPTFFPITVSYAFVDVNPGDTFYNEIMAAYSNGIIDASYGSYFRPNSYVTREEMSKMIYIARSKCNL